MDPRDDSPLTRRQQAELAAFADGRLEHRRMAAVGEWVAASPELQAQVAEQRRAISAARGAEVTAPVALRARVADLRHQRASQRRGLRLALGSGLAGGAVAAGLALALTLPGDLAGGPTIVQAAELSLRPPAASAPAQDDARPGLLRESTGGVPYPYWEDRFGWRASGARTDRLGDRLVTTVFYQRGARRIGYSIVKGARLPPPVATTDRIVEGVRLRSFLAEGRQVVTWVRDGRTCILSGEGVGMETLFALAGWRGNATA